MTPEERWAEIQEAIEPFARVFRWALTSRGDEELVLEVDSLLTGRKMSVTVEDFRRLVKACTPAVEPGTENERLADMMAEEFMRARREQKAKP